MGRFLAINLTRPVVGAGAGWFAIYVGGKSNVNVSAKTEVRD